MQSLFISHLLTILIICSRLSNLKGCPLPQNATCSECDVLHYIQLDPDASGMLNTNITVSLNLAESENSAHEFVQSINSFDNNDYSFDSALLPGDISDCYGRNPAEGLPCTHYIRMSARNNLPMCTWNYTCNYSSHRFPQYIWEAQCDTAPLGYRYQEIFYDIPTLTVSSRGNGSNCLPFRDDDAVYRWNTERIVVACVCIQDS